jgi:hypothetical protein
MAKRHRSIHNFVQPPEHKAGLHRESTVESKSLETMGETAAETAGTGVAISKHLNRCHSLRILLLVLCIVHFRFLPANGSSTPIALFTPPHFTARHPSVTLGQAGQIDYKNSDLKSSIETNVRRSRGRPFMSKVKSPSNSYTQFYKEGVLVGIERTSPNSRRISGEILIDVPIDDIWAIITDYDNLSQHVPNLVESKVINNGGRIIGGRPRVYQRGAQSIFGFEFGADVTMDMTECVHRGPDQNGSRTKSYCIDFECVDSQFFSQFDGAWILEESKSQVLVRYIVDVMPKGPVPVAALEWRIKEDVPVNILAVSTASRARAADRRWQQESIQAELKNEAPLQTQPQMLSPPHSLPETQLNPWQQLAGQAANNLKRTAKSVLPAPVISTARQAIKAINRSSDGRAPVSRRMDPVMSLKNGSGKRSKISAKINGWSTENNLDKVSVDWYEDETLASFLNDS